MKRSQFSSPARSLRTLLYTDEPLTSLRLLSSVSLLGFHLHFSYFRSFSLKFFPLNLLLLFLFLFFIFSVGIFIVTYFFPLFFFLITSCSSCFCSCSPLLPSLHLNNFKSFPLDSSPKSSCLVLTLLLVLGLLSILMISETFL